MCGIIPRWRDVIQLVSLFPILFSGIAFMFLQPSPASVGIKPFAASASPTKKQTNALLPIKTRLRMVLFNPGVQMLSIACFFIYIIRTGMSNWASLYLHTEKGFSQIAAGSSVFWMEIGGAIGSASGGWISDTIFSGRRGPINALFAFVSALVILGLQYPLSQTFTSVYIFVFGYCLYIPQTVSRHFPH
jgi:sugar phosphate permease